MLCALQGTSVPEKEARRIFQQMVIAVHYCHRLGIANRDIKVRSYRLLASRWASLQSLRLCCRNDRSASEFHHMHQHRMCSA